MDLAPLKSGALDVGIDLTPSQLEAFADFGAGLYRRNAVVNLTRVPEGSCAVRHFLDSILVSRLIGPDLTVLDIGCGPGFPSWPLAVARPDLRVTALDSWRKGLDFLREHPLPNLTLIEGRAEESVAFETFDVVTGRAFAPFAVQAEASAAWLRLGGLFVPFRTPVEADAINGFKGHGLGLERVGQETASLPEGAGERLFPVFRKVAKTDRRYPRRWAEMKAKPLV